MEDDGTVASSPDGVLTHFVVYEPASRHGPGQVGSGKHTSMILHLAPDSWWVVTHQVTDSRGGRIDGRRREFTVRWEGLHGLSWKTWVTL